jgi:hypothetical protein
MRGTPTPPSNPPNRRGTSPFWQPPDVTFGRVLKSKFIMQTACFGSLIYVVLYYDKLIMVLKSKIIMRQACYDF